LFALIPAAREAPMTRHDLVFQPASAWPTLAEYDVLVLGAGPSGIAAACAAARLGADVLLVDQLAFPGGVAAAACCPYLMGFAAGGRQIAGGVADDLVRELDGMGQAAFMTSPSGTPERRPIGTRPLTDNVIISVEGLRIGANRLLERCGVHRLYYTTLIGAVCVGDNLAAAAVDGPDGSGLLRARAFVDATGDAALVWRAGGEVRHYPVEESMTKTILLRVGGVPDFHRGATEEVFYRLAAAGKIPFKAQDRFMGFALLNPGEVLLNFTLTAGDGVSATDLTRMDIELREQAWVAVEWFRRELPQFAGCWLMDTATRVGVRAGRGIIGLETLTPQDIDADAAVPEPVGITTRGYGGHGITGFNPEWHRSNPGLRGIPWRALLSRSFGNVAAAGRGLSADPRVLDTVRLMARCMVTGQAAGVTAALAAQGGRSMADVGYPAVRQALQDGGAILP
jgi:hypothetical protein